EQGDAESLYDAWERFKLCLKRCPNHGIDELAQMQHFTQGLRAQTRMLLDASRVDPRRIRMKMRPKILWKQWPKMNIELKMIEGQRKWVEFWNWILKMPYLPNLN
ncbi:hypothetical protein A2U01_0054452, partial [Trifolium medium]|nr:hypothetical protein [Trifolium medium]